MKSFKFSALIAALSLAFAGAALATQPSGTATASGNGAINNSVSVSAMVGGTGAPAVGTSTSVAGSQAFSGATVTAGNWTSAGPGLFQQSNAATGSTEGWVSGYAGNQATGAGKGSANMTGWSDSQVQGALTGQVAGIGSYNVGAAIDNGSVTPVLHGPDVTLSTNGTNTGVSAVGDSGGGFAIAGNIAYAPAVNTVSSPSQTSISGSTTNTVATNGNGAYVSDSMDIGTFGTTQQGTVSVNGQTTWGGNVVALNAGATGTAQGNGAFANTVSANDPVIVAPSGTNNGNSQGGDNDHNDHNNNGNNGNNGH
jgi:hypothetical protein